MKNSAIFVTMGVGENIRVFRDSIGLSQQEVADFLGIQRELISYYESGSRRAPLETLEKLSTLFGVELDDLVGGKQTAGAKASLAFAFRTTALSTEDLRVVSDFRKVVRNYIKLVELKESHEREF